MDNEIKHGLDLPNEEADKICDYLMKKTNDLFYILQKISKLFGFFN